MKRGLVFSLLLHTIPMLLLLLGGGGGDMGGEGDSSPPDQTIIPKPDETEIDLVYEKGPGESKSPTPHENDPCDTYFGGIGIIHDPLGVISEAVAGYPAALAGITVGDILLTDTNAVKGDVGTSVVILYRRGNADYSVTLIRDKICTAD